MTKGAAMNKPFEFHKNARHDLIAVLRQRKFLREDIDAFIAGVQYDVDEWQFLWPPLSADDMGEGRRRLHNMEKAINSLIYDMSNLPLGWRQPLWTELEWMFRTKPGKRKIAITLQQANAFLRGFHAVINDQLDEGFFAGGRDNARKRHLVRRMAQRFEGVFGKRPAAIGAFMDVVTIIGDAVAMPIGKDAVGAILKELRASA